MELTQLLWSAAHPPDRVEEALGAAPGGPLAEVRRLQMVVEALVALAVEAGLAHEEIAEWLSQTLPAEAATLATLSATVPTPAPVPPARAAEAAAPVARAAPPSRAIPPLPAVAAAAPAPAAAPSPDYFVDDIFRTAAVAPTGPMTTCASCGGPVPAGRTNITASGEVCDGCYARLG